MKINRKLVRDKKKKTSKEIDFFFFVGFSSVNMTTVCLAVRGFAALNHRDQTPESQLLNNKLFNASADPVYTSVFTTFSLIICLFFLGKCQRRQSFLKHQITFAEHASYFRDRVLLLVMTIIPVI